jgi:hypothetical protein
MRAVRRGVPDGIFDGRESILSKADFFNTIGPLRTFSVRFTARNGIVPIAILLLLGFAPPEDRKHNETMNRIGRLVRLPDGAYPLDDYARFYADAGDGDVEAIYLIPTSFALNPGETCADTERVERVACNGEA